MENSVIEAFYNKKEKLLQIHIPRWDELPDLELYMDQLVYVLTGIFSLYIDDVKKLINPSIINNYVKLGYIPAPVKKKYSRTHIAYLVFVCTIKQMMPIGSIAQLLENITKTYPLSEIYDKLCSEIEKGAIHAIEEGENLLNDDETTVELSAISLAVKAQSYNLIASHLVESINKEEIQASEKKDKKNKHQ